jgi:hypothetical protein
LRAACRSGTVLILCFFATATPSEANTPPKVSSNTISPVVVSTTAFQWRTLDNEAFAAGEELAFVVKWGVVTGGHSNLTVKGIETINGRPAYHIVSEARSSGFVDTFHRTRDNNATWIDVQSLATLKYLKDIHEGRYRMQENVEIDQVQHLHKDFSNRLDKGTTKYAEGPVPEYAMDVLGSLYYVRTLPLEIGESFTIDVYDGKKVWPLVVNVLKREKIKVPAGRFDCWKVEPLLREPGIFMRKGKKLQVWLTADKAKMPVLMRSEIMIGHVSAELVSYHRPPKPH